MSAIMRCKACGFITDEAKLKGTCPACGMPKTAFEPYADPISSQRRKLINLDLHPMMVHFPQAFATMIPLFILASFILPGGYSARVLTAAEILTLLLPLTIVTAAITGLFDGKIRYKKYSSQYLKYKLIVGPLALLLSIALAAISIINPSPTDLVSVKLGLSIVVLGCNIILGRIGGRLVQGMIKG